MKNDGTHALRGSANWNAKLTEEQVREIRRRAASGTTHLVLAQEFGVGTTTIDRRVRRETWAHVQ